MIFLYPLPHFFGGGDVGLMSGRRCLYWRMGRASPPTNLPQKIQPARRTVEMCSHSRKVLLWGGAVRIVVPCTHEVYRIAGWSSLVARRAHNPKVVGSNPAPATKSPAQRLCLPLGFFSYPVVYPIEYSPMRVTPKRATNDERHKGTRSPRDQTPGRCVGDVRCGVDRAGHVGDVLLPLLEYGDMFDIRMSTCENR